MADVEFDVEAMLEAPYRKDFVLCVLFATITGIPNHHNVDTAVVAPENEPKSQEFPVPAEQQQLKTTVTESKDEPVFGEKSLKAAIIEVLREGEKSAAFEAENIDIALEDAVVKAAVIEVLREGEKSPEFTDIALR